MFLSFTCLCFKQTSILQKTCSQVCLQGTTLHLFSSNLLNLEILKRGVWERNVFKIRSGDEFRPGRVLLWSVNDYAAIRWPHHVLHKEDYSSSMQLKVYEREMTDISYLYSLIISRSTHLTASSIKHIKDYTKKFPLSQLIMLIVPWHITCPCIMGPPLGAF